MIREKKNQHMKKAAMKSGYTLNRSFMLAKRLGILE